MTAGDGDVPGALAAVVAAAVSVAIPLVVATAVLAAAAVLVRTRSSWAALPVLLDLLLVAGLLRLTVTNSWLDIASAALVVTVRHVAGAGLRRARAARARPVASARS